ncbi:hypothetical protein TM4_56 [Mycobacterium phage TM4]|uniref:Uncharacterized protein n=1 Tax=Mycobacterium phage TM4 TaxID=88870 RepID=Q9ZX23_BPMT4|nr:hypothetical protein TM4_gp56 [Mycobacterium phage TM4]AAD17622.1 hypothetical protein TM4_56 [Mycobacterium phage TM4]
MKGALAMVYAGLWIMAALIFFLTISEVAL